LNEEEEKMERNSREEHESEKKPNGKSRFTIQIWKW